MPMQPLETERLRIRPFTLEDVDDVHREVYSSADVWGPKTREEVAEGVHYASMMSRSDNYAFAKRAVTLKDSDTFIGQIRLDDYLNSFYRWQEEPDPPFNHIEVELSFAFGISWWGQSYAFEASQALIGYAFEELKLPRLVNGTGTENRRSINLHRRLGYRIFPSLPDDGTGIVAVLDNTRLRKPNEPVL